MLDVGSRKPWFKSWWGRKIYLFSSWAVISWLPFTLALIHVIMQSDRFMNHVWLSIWLNNLIQWGSENRTSLVLEWSKVFQWPNGLLFECYLNTGLNFVQYSEHHLIPNYHLNTGHLNTGQVKLCYSDVSVIQIPTVAVQNHKLNKKLFERH